MGYHFENNLSNQAFRIFNDYPKAEIVGIKGRQLAQDQFEYTRQGDKVLSFFSALLQTAWTNNVNDIIKSWFANHGSGFIIWRKNSFTVPIMLQ